MLPCVYLCLVIPRVVCVSSSQGAAELGSYDGKTDSGELSCVSEVFCVFIRFRWTVILRNVIFDLTLEFIIIFCLRFFLSP